MYFASVSAIVNYAMSSQPAPDSCITAYPCLQARIVPEAVHVSSVRQSPCHVKHVPHGHESTQRNCAAPACLPAYAISLPQS